MYIIGDSTVQNGSGKGTDSLWGWGSFMDLFLNTDKIEIQNHAKGGRSSRTFLTEGRWDSIMKTIKKHDIKYRIVSHICNGEKYYTIQYYGENEVVLKKFLGFPIKTGFVTDWFDIEVDVGSVDFCLMTSKRFKTKIHSRLSG